MIRQTLLSVRDALRIFNVSRRTVYYWIKKGILTPIRIGGVFRFHPEDIEALIERSRSKSSPRKKRILAIDDDLLVRDSLKNLLEREGFEAAIAANGQEALDLLSKEVFDLILTDIRMPGMSGLETLKAIRTWRARFGKPPLPEIILTAYDDPPVREEARRLGVREFILKPFELDSFLSTLRKNLNGA